MAWKTELYIRGAGEVTTVFADYIDFIENRAGWTLYDNISSTSKVFWTTGESGLLSKQYVHFYVSTNYIYCAPFVFWDITTHGGLGGTYARYGQSKAVLCDGAGIYRFFGNKNTVGVSAYATHAIVVGHFGADGDVDSFPLATISAGVSAGANVVLLVDNTTNFRVASSCVVVDYGTGIRETVEIGAISSGVSITINSLANAYTIGAVIGESPSYFGIQSSYSYYNYDRYDYIRRTIGSTVSGTGITNCLMRTCPIVPITGPSSMSDLYSLAPRRIASIDGGTEGYETYLRYGTLALGSVMLINADRQYLVGAVTGGSTTYMDDSSKSWTVNGKAGQTVAIVNGTGVNQARIILSNTATRLTFRDAMGIAPVAGSNYVLAEKSYFAAIANHLIFEENED